LITLFDKGLVPGEKQEPAMRAVLAYFSRIDYNQTPPQMGKDMHRIIREVLGDPDPYHEIKMKFNNLMLSYYPDLKKIVAEAGDRLAMALKLAIAGNIIDFGPNQPFDIDKTLNLAKSIVPAIDDTESLRTDISRAKTILYLGDNAGEIVLDKLLIETIGHPDVYFAVRGAPVINDATLEDAKAVGMEEVARVISNGDDAPGTILKDTSAEFREIFGRADLTIAKGHGNYEGLKGSLGNIYFVLLAKCDYVAGRLGVRKGDFVIKHIQSPPGGEAYVPS